MKDKNIALLGYLVLAIGLAILISGIAHIGKPLVFDGLSADTSSDASADVSNDLFVSGTGEYIADDGYKNIVLASPSAVVYDENAGGYKVLKDSSAQYATGDFNLIVTAAVAVDKLGAEHNFAVTDLSFVPEDACLAGLQVGDSLSMNMMLDALLVAHGADAAYVVAVETARVVADDKNMESSLAVASFVSMMNSYASSLGLSNTVFANPDGAFDSKQHSTAADMCKVALAQLKNDLVIKSAGQKAVTHTFNNGRSVTFNNNNKMLDNKSSAQYFDYANGLLAWSLSDDLNCLIATANIKGDNVVAVTLGAKTSAETYADAIALFYPTLEKAVLN